MKLDLYKEKLAELRIKHKKKVRELQKSYAYSNCTEHVDDIITDHVGSIRIDVIGITVLDGVPSCIYGGIEYTKGGKPFKSGSLRTVYQINLKKEKL